MDVKIVFLCISGIVILSVNCDQCPSGCETCKGDVNNVTCDSCNDGFWKSGSSCLLCHNNCATCSHSSSCDTCKPKYYFPHKNCMSECPRDCLNSECDDASGKCTTCPSGRYGNYCNQDCTLCKNEKCNKTRCTNGCKTGYYEDVSGELFHCLNCPTNCLSCKSIDVCMKCKDGYYLRGHDGSTYCEQCNANCAQCIDIYNCLRCEDGNYGNNCEYRCLDTVHNCTVCNGAVWNNITCQQCAHDMILYNNTCKTAPRGSCPTNCANCTPNNTCISCKTGWYGTFCNKSCGDKIADCIECHANISVQLTCTLCPDQYTLLDGECILSTISSVTNTVRPTDRTTTLKNVTTSTTMNTPPPTSPDRPDGISIDSTSETPRKQTQGNNKSIVIGAAGGGGGLILVVIIMITFFVCRRRRDKDGNSNNQHALAENAFQNDEDQIDYPVYAKPNKVNQTQQMDDYVYAQPNKPNKNTEQSNGFREEAKHSSLCNIAVSLQIDDADVDKLQLETLDGEFTSEIDMGTNIPTSDTYYNVDGLLRSRIQIPDLLEYVRKKKDFDAEFSKLPKGLQRSCNTALKVTNRKKNRFNGIYAYDATRVELKNNAYINANYIDGHNQPNAYIASLGPTSDTMNKFSTFWEMIWQENAEVVVMLTNLEEGGKMKCEQYWPNPGATKSCHDYSIKCTNENIFAEFVVRDLTLEKKGTTERRHVKHYHYIAWPDRYVPDTVASLVEFRDEVEHTKRQGDSPIVVHCSAGIGRTGTYIALDLLIKEGKDCGYVDLFGCALGLRGQRVNLIQNGEQYEYLHHAVLYALTCDTEPLSITALKKKMTGQRISEQFKAMKALISPSKRLSVWTANYSDRIENRKGADVPRDNYRVRLHSSKDDYINAVYINGYLRRNAYIASQTPLPSTVEGFLSMAYHERCSCIVSLDEENVAVQSVAQYLPNANEMLTFGNYQIRCNSINTCDDFIISHISIFKSPSEKLDTVHFQVRNWKSNEIVPSHPNSFLKLVNEVTTTVNTQNSSGPVLLQCLTGSQRCGVFSAVSIMLEKLAMDRYVSGAHIFSHIKRRRSTALQKQEMLKFCYHCVTYSSHATSDNDHCYYNTSSVRH